LFFIIKSDLKIWDNVVKSNRLTDQLCFPLGEETMLATEKAADRKLNQMQKMRALISYREAKYRYAAKIKSKRYHRILKRQKRKQLIKEFDELLIRDPEAAKEKLKELENQRIIERASLKHRARTKFQQDVVKYAGRDAPLEEGITRFSFFIPSLSSVLSLFLQKFSATENKFSVVSGFKLKGSFIDQAHIVAEAFKDDDVIGDFEEDKEFVKGERPKDVDLTLPGWGCWVGPGITERKRRKRFIIKAKQKRRNDQGKPGVIIKELEEPSISRLQPTELPFPYTSVVDFETMVSQPIGKDWNTIGTTHELCKPAVVTQGGRPIRPINKTDIIAGKLSLE
uniref:U3 small nucleolar RNA-associated protein 14 A n=1 Tax=Angiostrongylus costaricensis TaxID=334426 RepID=A0A0R3PLU5_ANGCS